MLSTYTCVVYLLVFLFTLALTTYHYGLPLLVKSLTGFRAASISPMHVRGLEWRSSGQKSNVVPTLRVETVGWMWGGWKGEETGMWVIKVEGISYRISKPPAGENEPSEGKKTPKRLSPLASKGIYWLLHILIHHWPSLARIVSLQVSDIRVIFDDMEGVELTLRDLRFGVKVDFEGDVSSPSGSSFPLSPSLEDTARVDPLKMFSMREGEMSPPPSPLAFTSLSLPNGPPSSTKSKSRLSHARRRASVIQSKMTMTASQIWSRAIARAHGSVSFTVSIKDVALILPHSNPPHPTSISTKPSLPNLATPQHSQQSTLKHQSSVSSLPPSPVSLSSLNHLLRSSTPRYALPDNEGGYERLAVLDGTSRAVLALGFGPRRGLLGEDTLRTNIELGSFHTTLGASDKLSEWSKANKKEKTPSVPTWRPHHLRRIILRAFEAVSVSFDQITISHFLPTTSRSTSKASSASDLSSMSTASSADFFTLSLDISELALKLTAADASNNERARNAFGSNVSPESIIRGVGADVEWRKIEFQCLAPGEQPEEKSQLLAIRQAEFSGFSSWRPNGWTRDEMLFANDPNLALLVMRGNISSVDVAADVQLLEELASAWGAAKVAKLEKLETPADVKTSIPVMPPRFRMVLDIGLVSILVADRDSKPQTTLNLASDGFQVSCFTSFADVVGRRRDKATTRAAFKEEEELRARREEAGPDVDYALPSSMLKPQVRRKACLSPASLQDDLSISMKGDATIALEPISLHMTLSGARDGGDTSTYHLAQIGRVLMSVSGDVLGKQEVLENIVEVNEMDWKSISAAVDVGVDHGIQVNLWHTAVLEALCAMGDSQKQKTPSHAHPPSRPGSLLARLPSGISGRISLGVLSVFVGQVDPNPECSLALTKGLWLQSLVLMEYAYYNQKSQTMNHRHHLTSAERRKLQLPEDITTQALAFANFLEKDQGRAALVSLTLMDTSVKPIFHGERFYENGGTKLSQPQRDVPKQREEDEFVGWEFRRPGGGGKAALKSGDFANNVPPLEISNTDQAQRPLLRIPHTTFNWLIQQPGLDAAVEHRVTGKVANVNIVSDLSHVYCALLAGLALKSISRAWKRERDPSIDAPPRPALNLSLDVSIPTLMAHFALPLKEQVFLYIKGIAVSKASDGKMRLVWDQGLVYVPSPRVIGSWEELARIKKLSVTPSEERILVDAEALRVRIPTAYQLSKLILNLNVSLKATKLLLRDTGGKGFSTTMKPSAEKAKRVPSMQISIANVSLEAKDNPIETNLNLIWRAGLVEQDIRNALEDTFEQKMVLIAQAENEEVDEYGELHATPLPAGSKLSAKHTVSLAEARQRLDWWKSRCWIKRIRAAKSEQRRRESAALQSVQNVGADVKLPISLAPASQTAPLFRFAARGVKFVVSDPKLTKAELVDYMGQVATPFKNDPDFSLLIPLDFRWEMESGQCLLRDYPLPLVNVQPVLDNAKPSWTVTTLFVIAEELAGDDSLIMIPCLVIPEGCGSADAHSFSVQIAKTIMPVKTYAKPVIKIASEKTTEFTWGNSYQPAIQDFMRVMETLSHPPRDPSPRVGFWDKFRLILHWRVSVDFVGPCHLHLKGSYDPYSFTGFGAGFALSWKHNTHLEINHPNPQYETIQISAEELLIAIPDLTALHDGAAIGSNILTKTPSDPDEESVNLGDRRYTKPCARFLNGVRVGFGFALERTCRPHTCVHDCGSTENLMHRQCRIFDFKPHQEIILRSKEAVDRDCARLGRAIDSYEGFRSDFVHFSVSLVAPTDAEEDMEEEDGQKHNSLHFSPKAFAHFFAWWHLFNQTMSLPIRQGKLFPDSPPPSKKFGRSLGTIKYRFDLAPIFVSHIYSQVSKELWAGGQSQSLGLKARFRRFRADAHQRAQEKTVRHEKLHRTTVVVHKPFYAADLMLEDIQVKGVCADFNETTHSNSPTASPPNGGSKASDLPKDTKAWYNFFDFIDADKKPFDRNPTLDVVNLGDCPEIFVTKRVKARQTSPSDDDDDGASTTQSDSTCNMRLAVESSKFGHEKSHICYLGAAEGVGPTQMKITRQRIRELQGMIPSVTSGPDAAAVEIQRQVILKRLKTLHDHLDMLSKTETRHIDDDTLQPTSHSLDQPRPETEGSDVTFENTVHIHAPRIFFNNQSRNYYFSSRDRKREEYTTSHASLRGVRDGISRRMREQKESNEDHVADEDAADANVALEMLRKLEKAMQDSAAGQRFQLPVQENSDHEDSRKPSHGLPAELIVKPKTRLLMLKPQIALRSEVDENAVILLAVEEVSFKEFSILDEAAFDTYSSEVMSRNYISMQGLQAFYPCDEARRRDRMKSSAAFRDRLDFVPLEIFLDVRSEALDYDRIVLKTDAAISLDKFNHLRLPRGLDWPKAEDGDEESIRHLALHQDLTTVIVPRLTVSATAKHYAALFYVVTDLILYQDPEHQHRNERVEAFTFAFDRKDRDPQRLLLELSSLQQSIRSLSALQRGYEQNVDLLTDDGKGELFKIRTDLLEATEQLFTVFEAIAANQSRDDARAAKKTAARLEVRAGGIAWHMLADNFSPLVKLDISNTVYSWVSNKDGSTDSAVVIRDLCALNSNADALFPEVVIRHESSSSAKKKVKESFASACWSIHAPVGGITIIFHFAFYLHPIKFKLEEKVGHQMVRYIFNDNTKRAKAESNGNGHGHSNGHGNGNGNGHGHGQGHGHGNDSELSLPPLHRTKSSLSIMSDKSRNGSSKLLPLVGEDSHVHAKKLDAKFTMVPSQDAAEMRRRASTNKTFVTIIFGATSFVFSYKSDDEKKHNTFSLPDCVDFKIKAPEMNYYNKVWGFEDLFDHVKRDIRSYAWSQTGDILSQVIKKTSVFRGKKHLRHLAALTSSSTPESALAVPKQTTPSRLRYQTEAVDSAVTLPGSPGSNRSNGIEGLEEDEHEPEPEHEHEKGLKGFLGKLRRGSVQHHSNTSKEDLTRVKSNMSRHK
ncbi:hypothetical protein P7C73_g5753, partial [Tremellales sp. Uapishka_1]